MQSSHRRLTHISSDSDLSEETAFTSGDFSNADSTSVSPSKGDKHGTEDDESWSISRSHKVRILVGFWILGMCNNFGYSVMLTAAYDILESSEKQDEDGCKMNETLMSSHTLICNQAGTGVILLADILPALFIKLTAPFYMNRISYNVKVVTCLFSATGSFIIVAVAGHTFKWLSIIGVVSASISSGLGEIVFLSFTAHFSKHTISTWASGTGAAGIFGAVTYSGFTQLGLSPRDSLLLMIVVPLLEALSYFCLIVKPRSVAGWYIWSRPNHSDQYTLLSNTLSGSSQSLNRGTPTSQLSLRQKLMLVQPLLKYMIPLMLVYIFEYFINQALMELAYFPDSCDFMSIHAQYRWYQTMYQIGVFLSRSSVSCIKLRYLWVLPLLQFMNVVIVLCQVLFHYLPASYGLWLMFGIIVWEGLLGGSGYVNTFYRISQDVAPEHKEYSLGVASVADTTGVMISAFLSIAVHNKLCSINIKWK